MSRATFLMMILPVVPAKKISWTKPTFRLVYLVGLCQAICTRSEGPERRLLLLVLCSDPPSWRCISLLSKQSKIFKYNLDKVVVGFFIYLLIGQLYSESLLGELCQSSKTAIQQAVGGEGSGVHGGPQQLHNPQHFYWLHSLLSQWSVLLKLFSKLPTSTFSKSSPNPVRHIWVIFHALSRWTNHWKWSADIRTVCSPYTWL